MERVDVYLRRVLREGAAELAGGRGVRRRLADDREQPEEGGADRDEQGGKRLRRAAQIGPREQHAGDCEAEQQDPEEHRRARVNQEHLHADCRKPECERPARVAQEEEEEGERCRYQHIAVDGARLREQRVRPAVAGGEGRSGHGRGEHPDAEPGGAKQRHSRLVHDGECDRHDRARLVLHHLRRVDARELRDQREKRVPERERVARMQAAVAELVDAAHVQVAEVDELANAPEMEERVAGDGARNVPQQRAENEAG
jgi:hypothetical protein